MSITINKRGGLRHKRKLALGHRQAHYSGRSLTPVSVHPFTWFPPTSLLELTSCPALWRMPSIAALPSSNPVRVPIRAPARAAPPTNEPRRIETDVDFDIIETNDATGPGRRVGPEAAACSGVIRAEEVDEVAVSPVSDILVTGCFCHDRTLPK